MRRLLLPALLSALMTAPPAGALSTITLPVTVPLAGVQAAANARVPSEFARLEETRTFLGGLLSARLTGTVTRAAHVSVQPTPEGDGLTLSVPITAKFRAEPAGLGQALARDFGGSAVIRLRVRPTVTPDWEADVGVSGTYTWTDPLSVDLGQGVKVSVQSLVDGQVRAQLDRVAADVARAVREGADLRRRAGTLWARVQQPWTLPLAEPTYARVLPRSLTVTPFRFTPEALKLTVGAALDLSAGLGQVQASPPTPLPPLKIAPLPASGVDLQVPVRLPYAELSDLASRRATQQTLTLAVPLSPTLRVSRVVVSPRGSQLNVAVGVVISGPLGLSVRATADVTGTPTVDASGHLVTLGGVTVTTRREGLTGRVIGWLADERAQAYLTRAARFDLAPRLAKVRAQVQARLPFTPAPGVQLLGHAGPLRLSSIRVTPQALVVTGASTGDLTASVDVGALR
ncbi:DUF4403 family protein [Deinococcus hopiensis]|uniref:DUF4403 family protein n=1 Tax=Deinococcus hopiensis KR-140 TaxID=695939 RepID=A0A1W1VQG6_9DEIO|nr:DUF4403 family protein [Deinococcus hopiensis]SMB95599.1 protein of unknown function [Deinococcus hopiensis KR-140]